jgi:phosphohistidine phosphatase
LKTLGLLRHAKAELDDPGARDFDRGLSEPGKSGAALVGRAIADHGLRWDSIVASPAERVRRTLEASGLPGEPRFDERVYLADAATLLEVLRAVPGDPASVLVVGHNPGLHELLFRLVDPDDESPLVAQAYDKFPTAAFALLELAIDDWASLSAGCGKLIRFIRPRDLDPTLGPARVG